MSSRDQSNSIIQSQMRSGEEDGVRVGVTLLVRLVRVALYLSYTSGGICVDYYQICLVCPPAQTGWDSLYVQVRMSAGGGGGGGYKFLFYVF